jgi:tRNA threonylcarbamoyladenosine modification (KEOPS) complex Cgi121 subunit
MEMGVGEQSRGVGIGMLYRPYESGKAATDSVWMEMRLRIYGVHQIKTS